MKLSFALRPLERIAKLILLSCYSLITICLCIPASADDYYLQPIGEANLFDNVPVGTMTEWAPFIPFLLNYDFSRDSDPGLIIAAGGSNHNESDSTKYQTWVIPGSEPNLDGPASLTLHAALAGFATGDKGKMKAMLVECDQNGGNCSLIANGQIDSSAWSGGWDAFDVSFGTVKHTVAPGKVLGVKLVVLTASDSDMMVAYGSSSFQSKLSVTKASNILQNDSLATANATANATAPPADEVILQVVKSADRTEANAGESIKYTLQYNCVSTIAAGNNVTISDVMDPLMTVTGLTNSVHIASSNFNPGTNEVTFTFVDPLPAGASGEVHIFAEFKPEVVDDYIAPNIANIDAVNAAAVASNQVDVRAEVSSTGGPSYEKGVSIFKDSWDDDLDLPFEQVSYRIAHGNTGGPGEPVLNYVVRDTFPAELKLKGISTGEFPGTGGNVDISYQVVGDSTWHQWGGYATNYDQWLNAGNLGLANGIYVTAIQFDYGTLPGGGSFHPDASGVEPIDLYFTAVDPSVLVVGDDITNCGNVTADESGGGVHYDETSCYGVEIKPARPEFFAWDHDINGGGPYDPGDVMRMRASFGQKEDSGVDMVNPMLMSLLPVGFTYEGNDSVSGQPYSEVGSPAYDVEVIPDFAGTSRELVRLTFPGGLTLVPIGESRTIYFDFDMSIVSGASFGTFQSQLYATWDSPLDSLGASWRVTDTLDYDGDGNTTEKVSKDTTWWQVGDPGSGVASLDSVMGVKGELDSSYSRFPDTGLTVPSGRADYELSITNSGGVALKDLTVIEILPHVGDRGVIDLSDRNSEWAPFLAGAVAVPAGMEVFYSTSGNPCRDELSPGIPSGCDPPAWTSSLPSDPTTVKSLKFVQTSGDWLMSGEEILIEWPMRAAINAPTNGEIAWSSFGVVATRADNNLKMLPSEPMKVGIGIQPPQPPFYGDTVWYDENRDGIQDAGELGINGVRVELYTDNGDGVADPNVDDMYSFTVSSNDGSDDGQYLFPYLPPADYFAVFYAPDEYVVSPSNSGSDDVDSDGVAETFNGSLVTVTAVTTISINELDMSWDQGFYDRSALPAVWAIANLGGGSVVIGGKFESSHGVNSRNIAVLGPNGTPSGGFSSGTGFDGVVRALAVTDDGKILAGGEFTSYNGNAANGLALLNADGTFVPGLAMPNVNDVRWVGASGSQFYVAGGFTSLGGVSAPCVGRLNSNGTVDSSFQPGEGADGPIHCAAVSGGGLIIGGSFSSYQGNPAVGMARLNSNGTIDPSFSVGSGFDGSVNSITSKGGMIFAVGDFTTCNDLPTNGAARLSPTGAVDVSFGDSSLSVTTNRASN